MGCKRDIAFSEMGIGLYAKNISSIADQYYNISERWMLDLL